MARSGPRSKSMPRTVPAQPQAHATAKGGARLPRRLRHANRASAGHTKITARGTITKGAVTGTIQVMCRLTIRECQPTRCRTWAWISSTASSRNPEATLRRNATPRNVRSPGARLAIAGRGEDSTSTAPVLFRTRADWFRSSRSTDVGW